MDANKTLEEILQRRKERDTMLDEIANSSSATEDASDVFDSSIEYGIHTFVHKPATSSAVVPRKALVNDKKEKENVPVEITPVGKVSEIVKKFSATSSSPVKLQKFSTTSASPLKLQKFSAMSSSPMRPQKFSVSSSPSKKTQNFSTAISSPVHPQNFFTASSSQEKLQTSVLTPVKVQSPVLSSPSVLPQQCSSQSFADHIESEETNSNSNVNANISCNADANINSNVEMNSDSNMEASNNFNVEANDNLNVETNISSNAEPIRDSNVEPNKASNVEENINSDVKVGGSLLDDINNELELYERNARNAKSEFSTSFGSDNSLHHSISLYRREGRNKRFSMAPTVTTHLRPTAGTDMGSTKSLVMDVDSCDSVSMTDSRSLVDTKSMNSDATSKRLYEAIVVQQDQISQASRALMYCRQLDGFRGSREEVDAQRALLIATERRHAYLTERDRLISVNQNDTFADETGPRGTLIFSCIAVLLSRDFVSLYTHQSSAERRRYYFIVLIKHKETVLHTTLADSNDCLKSGFVEFKQYISLGGLLPDYECTVEVFGLRSVTSSPNSLHQGDKSKKKNGGTLRKKLASPVFGYEASKRPNSAASMVKSSRPPMPSTAMSSTVIDSDFQRMGYVRLNRTHLTRERFMLMDTMYPLDGNIVVKMRCHAEKVASTSDVTFSGFLSLYEVVSGLGSWTRFWCVLSAEQLCFWRYPEDEERKPPCAKLELVKCISNVSEVSDSLATFPNSMQLDVLETVGDNVQKETRKLFAADTPEEMLIWMDALNRAIHNSNVWNNNYPTTATAFGCSSTVKLGDSTSSYSAER